MGKRYFFMTGKECADFADEFNHPLLHVCFDVGHANMRNTSIFKDITDIGGHLNAIHFQDNFGTFDEHIAPLLGSLDVDAVMQALLKINYGGYFTFESDNFFKYDANSWLHPKKFAPEVTAHKLTGVSLDIKRQSEALLYSIGKYILEQYDCFED